MTRHEPIVGVVLAGGRSRRFGVDKALFRVPGETRSFTSLALAVLRPLVDRLVLVRAAPLPDLPRDVLQVADPCPGDGPVQALAAAFAAAPAACWLVAPCDMPFLRGELYVRLLEELERSGAACYRSSRGLEPLVSGFRASCAAALRPRPSMEATLRDLDAAVLEVPPDQQSFFLNVNTREDLNAMLGAAERPGKEEVRL